MIESDAMDSSQYISEAKSEGNLDAVLQLFLVIQWLTFLFLAAYLFLIWIPTIIVLFARKHKAAVPSLIYSPFFILPILFFAYGETSYIFGKATYQGLGFAGFEYSNIDRRTRVGNSNSGCGVYGYEFFTQVPNNAAVWMMGGVFGPMPGSYRGPYPTKDETLEILENATPATLIEMNGKPVVFFSGREMELESWKGIGWLSKPDHFETNSIELAASMVGNECFILGVNIEIESEKALFANLIDASTGKRFAGYWWPQKD